MRRTYREYNVSRGQGPNWLRSCPHKACEVQNVLIAGDLHELGSLLDPLEDHDTVIRNEEPGIRSTELRPPNLFFPVKNWSMIRSFQSASRVKTAIASPLGSSFDPMLRSEA